MHTACTQHLLSVSLLDPPVFAQVRKKMLAPLPHLYRIQETGAQSPSSSSFLSPPALFRTFSLPEFTGGQEFVRSVPTLVDVTSWVWG